MLHQYVKLSALSREKRIQYIQILLFNLLAKEIILL